MEDIVPGLLEAIQKDFAVSIKNNKAIERVANLIESGAATYKDANDYATWTGQLLTAAIKKNVTAGALPDGRMYYNIADRILGDTLKNDYDMITKVTDQIQTSMNRNAGIGIKSIKPGINQDRIDGLVNRVAGATDFNAISWILEEPIINFHQSIVDDSIKANAEFHAKSGLTAKIVRTTVGDVCDWCKEVAGSYTYPDVPDDVYKRHDRCRCTVEYTPTSGKRQNVWTKELL